MRNFENCQEAFAEIKRDVIKFGRVVKPQTQQNKSVTDTDQWWTKEIQLYSFSVINDSDHLQACKDPDWVLAEITERCNQKAPWINPGEAWKLRKEYWEKYMIPLRLYKLSSNTQWSKATWAKEDNHIEDPLNLLEYKESVGMGYSYNERMGPHLSNILALLKKDPDTRRAILPIWDNAIDTPNIGKLERVSCSMYYVFQIRDKKLDIHYHIRSCDIFEHFTNDFALACQLKLIMAQGLLNQGVNIKAGYTRMVIDSLHAYKKDIEAEGIVF